jgi:hypothetical protein
MKSGFRILNSGMEPFEGSSIEELSTANCNHGEFVQLLGNQAKEWISVAPPGLVLLFCSIPRACALGYFLPPLRG